HPRIAPLFDYPVGAPEHRWRDGEAECLRRLKVDDKLESRWLLDRQRGRLRAVQDLVDIKRRAAPQVGDVDTVGHEPARLGELAVRIDREQVLARREAEDLGTLRHDERIAQRDERMRAQGLDRL